MDIYDSGAMPEREVSEYASSGAHWLPIARNAGECHVGRMRVEPGGVIGMHPTRSDQMFFVIDGRGWTRIDGGPRSDVAAGHAVLLRAGEHHESGTDTGMTAIIVQAEQLAIDLH